MTIRHPRVVIEVLSPTTEATDRGKKAAYLSPLPLVALIACIQLLIAIHLGRHDHLL